MGTRFPLEGIRVLEFCAALAGPYTTRFLAIYGAQVIRVESQFRIDPGRGAPPMPPGQFGINSSAYFNNANPSKLSLSLNLRHPRGREIARQLAAMSDIVVDNFTPHTMENLGLGYDDLVKLKPDIIVVRMPAFGITGPYKEYRSVGQQVESFSGLSSFTGFPGGRPAAATGQPWPDTSSGPTHAAAAILAALHYRNLTGKGQCIEMAFCEAPTSWLETAILDYTVNGQIQAPAGNRVPNAAPHGVYRCQGDDRWCAIAVFDDGQWEAFCRVVDQPDWTQNEDFATLDARKAHEDELDRLIGEWTRDQTAEEVMLVLQRSGVPAGVVQNGRDLLTHDPQLAERGMYNRLAHPEVGEVLVDSIPFSLSECMAEVRRPPLFGEHTDFVCKELLYLTEEEIDQLVAENVLA